MVRRGAGPGEVIRGGGQPYDVHGPAPHARGAAAGGQVISEKRQWSVARVRSRGAVAVGVAVGVTVTVAVGVALGFIVGVAVGVTVGVGVKVAVGDAHGVPCPWHQVMLTVSTRQPSLDSLLSLAIRQRSLPGV